MTVRRASWQVAVALMLFTLAARRAGAQPSDDASRAEARKIGYAGVEAFQAGDFTTAHDRLETAYRLLKVPSLGLWSARALAKLGKLVEADARYVEVIKLPTSVGDEAIQEQARQDASRRGRARARRSEASAAAGSGRARGHSCARSGRAARRGQTVAAARPPSRARRQACRQARAPADLFRACQAGSGAPDRARNRRETKGQSRNLSRTRHRPPIRAK